MNFDQLVRRLFHYRSEEGGEAASLKRLFGFAKPYRGRLVLAGFSMLIGGGILLAFPYAVRLLIDSALVDKDVALLNRMVSVLAVGLLLGGVFNMVKTYQAAYVGERIVADIRELVFRHLQSLSLSFFDHHRTGEMMSHITNDAALVQHVLSRNLLMIPQHLATGLVALVMVIVTDWRLAAYLALVAPFLAVSGVVFGRMVRRLSHRIQELFSVGTTVLEETLSCQRIVKTFAREDYEIGRFHKAIEDFFRAGVRRIRIQALFDSLTTTTLFLGLVGLFWMGGHEVMAGRLTPGALISFILYGAYMISPMGALVRQYADFQQALGASDRIFALLATLPEVEDAPNAYSLPAIDGRLSIRNLSFAYAQDGELGRPVLRGIDLEVEPGRTVAIVGPSGAGKTTLINLIPRFYDPQSGTIALDGHDIAGVTQSSLREALAIVPQEAVLFSGTIRENIRYGRLDATDAELEAAARAANAHEFIERLERGYETMVGERGIKLSGGQRQRVAIARAILRNPRLLILDEATSSLDNESEMVVQEALDRLMKGRTTLVIAHRLTTIEAADLIVVLHQGRIVERGDHASLMAEGALYYRLYTRDFAETDGAALTSP